jgi:tRNA-dihydrouridine synthase
MIGKPPMEEMVETMLRHARLQIEFKGDYLGIREMRKHAAWYTAGYKGAIKLRGLINNVESYQELEELFERFMNQYRGS